jgi:tetratricopeptide (TPR) repeat protein
VLETARLYVEVEPLSAISYTQAANFHVAVGDVDGAAVLLEKALELDAGMRMTLPMLGFCRTVQGRLEEAADLLRKAVEMGLPAGYMYLPAALVLSGRTEEARETVEALEKAASERYVWPLARALAWAALDERERCLGLLGEAEAEGSPMFTLTVLGPGGLALAPAWLQDWFEVRRQQMVSAIRAAGGDPVARSGPV